MYIAGKDTDGFFAICDVCNTSKRHRFAGEKWLVYQDSKVVSLTDDLLDVCPTCIASNCKAYKDIQALGEY